MMRVNIRYFRAHLRECLEKLPVVLTQKDKSVAIVVTPEFFDYVVEKMNEHRDQDSRGPQGV